MSNPPQVPVSGVSLSFLQNWELRTLPLLLLLLRVLLPLRLLHLFLHYLLPHRLTPLLLLQLLLRLPLLPTTLFLLPPLLLLLLLFLRLPQFPLLQLQQQAAAVNFTHLLVLRSCTTTTPNTRRTDLTFQYSHSLLLQVLLLLHILS